MSLRRQFLRFLCITVICFQTVFTVDTISSTEKSAVNGNSAKQNEALSPIECGASANGVINDGHTVPSDEHETPTSSTVTKGEKEVYSNNRNDTIDALKSTGDDPSANLTLSTANSKGSELVEKFANNLATPAYNRLGRPLVGKCARELVRLLDPSWKTSLECEAEEMVEQQQQEYFGHQQADAFDHSPNAQQRRKGIRIDEQRAELKLRQEKEQRKEEKSGKLKMIMENEETEKEDD